MALFVWLRRCGLIGERVSLGVALGSQKPIPSLESLFLLPVHRHSQLCGGDELNLGTVSKPRLNAFLYESCSSHGVFTAVGH